MFIPPSFVMQWQAGVQRSSVFTVHLSRFPHSTFDVQCSMFDVHQCSSLFTVHLSPFPHSMLDVQCSMLDVRQYSMFNLPAMPLDNLGAISSCFSPVTMFIPPSFVVQWQAGVQRSSVFTVHLSRFPHSTFDVQCSMFDVHQCSSLFTVHLSPFPHSMLDVQCSMLDVRQYSMFNLPAMPLDNLGAISSCFSPVTMFIPPSFVVQWQAGVQRSSVFTVHLSRFPHSTFDVQCSMFDVHQCSSLFTVHLSPFPHSMLDVQCSMLDVRQYSMFNLPAMPLDNLGGISSCFSPITMFIPPSFVVQWQAGVQRSSVFTVHLSRFPHSTFDFNVRCSTFISVHQCLDVQCSMFDFVSIQCSTCPQCLWIILAESPRVSAR